MNGPYLFSYPRPKLGDAVERTNLNTRKEQALVINIISPSDDSEDWQGVLMTRNGVEFISSDREMRGEYDWRPVGWVFHKQRNCFVPPHVRWDEDTESFVDATANWDVPAPREGEKYPSWKSRVFRTLPELKDDAQAASILAEAWQNRGPEASV